MIDEEIVALIQKGNKEKFREIVERYETKLFWYVKRLVNQPGEEVEDLLQEVFLNAYVNLQGFDTGKKFSSWIYRIAHNKAIDYFKKKKIKRVEIVEEMEADDKKLIEELEIEKEERGKIRRLVADLELKYKEVIELFYFEEKNYEEISDILHIPTSNVGVLLNRAKKKLKEKL